jgi:hypothetical protein
MAYASLGRWLKQGLLSILSGNGVQGFGGSTLHGPSVIKKDLQT